MLSYDDSARAEELAQRARDLMEDQEAEVMKRFIAE